MERARAKAFGAKAGGTVLNGAVLNGVVASGAALGNNLRQGFSIGALQLRFYSLLFVGAIVLGYVLARYRAKRDGVDPRTIEDLFFWLVVNSFLAARAYYVIFYFSAYKDNLAEIVKVWHGGLAIYGAIIGGVLTLAYFGRKTRLGFLKLADLVAFGLPLAQALGRFGNYFNYEAFGVPTNLPWKMYVPPQFRPPGYQQFDYFHPTFLYESIWDVLVFVVLLLLLRKRPRTGIVAGVYLLLYSIGRFVIEGIRLDSAFFGRFRGDQLTALFMIIVALGIIRKAYVTQTR